MTRPAPTIDGNQTLTSGIPVVVSPYLCVREFVEWRRTNRNNRIAKKWRKRYGAVTRCNSKAYMAMGRLHICPCGWAKVKREMANTGVNCVTER